MAYLDGYVLPIPTKNIAAYRRIARKAGEIGREYGALEYKEWVADDLNAHVLVPFPQCTQSKPDKTVILAYIVFKHAQIATASMPRS